MAAHNNTVRGYNQGGYKMRVFTALCKEARGYMVLSEASYNEACMWLYRRLGNPLYTASKDGVTEIVYMDREFIYDENKGYLIEKEDAQ